MNRSTKSVRNAKSDASKKSKSKLKSEMGSKSRSKLKSENSSKNKSKLKSDPSSKNKSKSEIHSCQKIKSQVKSDSSTNINSNSQVDSCQKIKSEFNSDFGSKTKSPSTSGQQLKSESSSSSRFKCMRRHDNCPDFSQMIDRTEVPEAPLDPKKPLGILELENYIKQRLSIGVECKINEFLQRILSCERAFIFYSTEIHDIVEFRAFGMDAFDEPVTLCMSNQGLRKALYQCIPMFDIGIGRGLGARLEALLGHTFDSFLAVSVTFPCNRLTLLFCLINKMCVATVQGVTTGMMRMNKVKVVKFNQRDADYIRHLFGCVNIRYDYVYPEIKRGEEDDREPLGWRDFTLLSLGEKLLRTLTGPNVVELTVLQLRNYLNTQVVSLYVLNRDTNEITARIQGKTEHLKCRKIRKNFCLQINSDSVICKCMRERKMLNSNDGHHLACCDKKLDKLVNFNTENFLVIPIQQKNLVYGALELSNKLTPGGFVYLDEQIAQQFSLYLCFFLKNEYCEAKYVEMSRMENDAIPCGLPIMWA